MVYTCISEFPATNSKHACPLVNRLYILLLLFALLQCAAAAVLFSTTVRHSSMALSLHLSSVSSVLLLHMIGLAKVSAASCKKTVTLYQHCELLGSSAHTTSTETV
jgi:hypothetical protein